MSPRDAGNKVGIGLWPAKVCRLCRLRSIQCKAHVFTDESSLFTD